eukprot:CFRG6444T1
MSGVVNVSQPIRWARYGALGCGIVYGFFHNRTVATLEAKRQAFEHRRHEAQAKKDKEYADLVMRASMADGVVTDPNAPGFDVEKLIAHYAN